MILASDAPMPIHDWTQVEAGIFHDFHVTWLPLLKARLNGGLLPPDFYALAEQCAGDIGPEVLSLHKPPLTDLDDGGVGSLGGLAVETAPPQIRYRQRQDERRWYARKANRLVIRHISGDKIVAVIELVSPGNKSSESAVGDFVEKANALIERQINLLVVDLFPPTRRDPAGLHQLIWGDGSPPIVRNDGQVLTASSYRCGEEREAFVEPLAVGDRLPDMPLFLTSSRYILIPLEETYMSAFTSVPPQYQRKVQRSDHS